MNKRYGADLPAWILIGGLSCCALLIAYADVSASGSLDALAVSFIFVSLLGFAWLLSFQIELTPSEIIFRSLFRGRRRIRNDQIKKVSLTCDFRKRTSGPLQLIVEPRDHSIQQLKINAKVFSRAAVDAVLKRGRSCCRGGRWRTARRGVSAGAPRIKKRRSLYIKNISRHGYIAPGRNRVICRFVSQF
jgi:hypothetical protein